MVVYAEFLIHPVVLLMTSTRMRSEIGHTLKRLVATAGIGIGGSRHSGGGAGGPSCSCSSWATGCVKVGGKLQVADNVQIQLIVDFCYGHC